MAAPLVEMPKRQPFTYDFKIERPVWLGPHPCYPSRPPEQTRDRSNITNSFPTRQDSGALRRISRSYRELPLAEVRSANGSRTGE